MVAYCAAVRELESKFDGIELHHVKRSDNMAADNLARIGAARDPVPKETFLEILHKPSIKYRTPGTPSPTSTEEEAGKEHEPAMVPLNGIVDAEPDEGVFAVLPDWTQPLLAYLIKRRPPSRERPKPSASSAGPRHTQ